MAFGSWFKNLIGKTKGFIADKVIPVLKQGANIVSNIAPTISKIGGAVGGDFGNLLSNIGNTAGTISGNLNNRLNGKPSMLGRVSPLNHLNDEAGGAGRSAESLRSIDRFEIPLLK